MLKNTTKMTPGTEQCAALAASDAALDMVKHALLDAFANEPNTDMRYKLLFTLAAYAGLLVPQRKWDSLMANLMQFARSERPEYASLAIRVTTTLITDLSSLMQQNFAVLVDLLHHVLPNEEQAVRAATLEFYGALLSLADDDADVAGLVSLVPVILGHIQHSIAAGDTKAAIFGIDAFIAVAESNPLFLKAHMQQLIDTMLGISELDAVKGRCKRMAMEFICTVAESRIGLLRRHGNVLQRALPTLLRWMAELEDEPEAEWEAEDDDDFPRSFRIARDDLDRLSQAFADKTFLGIFFNLMTELLGSAQWQLRHAGLMALMSGCEGMAEHLTADVNELVVQLTPLFSDPHPRVRWAAQTCLAQMATDLGPSLQEEAHAAFMNCTLTSLEDSSFKVRVQAASTVVNFCEKAESDVTALYADVLLSKLGALLHVQAIEVQQWALTAIAGIASSCKSLFVKYVDAVMPICMEIVRAATAPEHSLLRARAFEAATYIGVAVGKAQFAPYVDELMHHIMGDDVSLSNEDPHVRLLIDSSARVAEVLQEDFAPFLPKVMGPLLELATTDALVREAEDDESDNDEWEFHDIDGKRYGIHQPSLECMADALQVLARYAEYVGAAFAQYVPQIAEYVLKTIDTAPSERLQETSVSILPFLVHSVAKLARLHPSDDGAQELCASLSRSVIQKLDEMTREEADVEMQHLLLQAMVEVLQTLAKEDRRGLLDDATCNAITGEFTSMLDDALARRGERDLGRADEDHDDDLEANFEAEEEQDTTIMINCIELLENALKINVDSFVPYWREHALQYAERWLSPDAPTLPIDVHLGVCILDDIVEYGGQAGLAYFDVAIQQQLRFALADDCGVRQAALYGLGASAQAAAERFAPHCNAALDVLWQTIDAPATDNDDVVQVIENALSAVAKIVVAMPNTVPAAELVARFVSRLPITVDDVEAHVIYDKFVQFASLYPASVFGSPPTPQRIGHLLHVIGTSLETKCVNEQLTTQFIALVKYMQQQLPAADLTAAYAMLENVPRQRIERALAAHP
jgi:hypothetical protein